MTYLQRIRRHPRVRPVPADWPEAFAAPDSRPIEFGPPRDMEILGVHVTEVADPQCL